MEVEVRKNIHIRIQNVLIKRMDSGDIKTTHEYSLTTKDPLSVIYVQPSIKDFGRLKSVKKFIHQQTLASLPMPNMKEWLELI